MGFYEVPVITSQHGNEDDDTDNEDDIGKIGDSIDCTAIKSYPYIKDKKIIDMYKVFHHNFIKNSVYQVQRPTTTYSCNRHVGRVW